MSGSALTRTPSDLDRSADLADLAEQHAISRDRHRPPEQGATEHREAEHNRDAAERLDARERRSDERDWAADRRERDADERQRDADERERVADQRDQLADQREL